MMVAAALTYFASQIWSVHATIHQEFSSYAILMDAIITVSTYVMA